jgi:hypothetical protein
VWLTCDPNSNRLLGVQLCLTEGDGGQPQLIDCPEERDWEVASGAECGEAVTLPKGIEVAPACAQQTSSPCNAVPWLPSSEWKGGGEGGGGLARQGQVHTAWCGTGIGSGGYVQHRCRNGGGGGNHRLPLLAPPQRIVGSRASPLLLPPLQTAPRLLC